MSFPCVMKLEYGSGAVGVSLVHDVDDCRRYWTAVQSELDTDLNHPGIGLGHGSTMLLMDYIGGSEHSVDVVIYRYEMQTSRDSNIHCVCDP